MTKPSVKASSVWPEMPFMRGPAGAQRLRQWLPAQQQIRAKTAARRERVLAHEWARKRLSRILGVALVDVVKWNGFVPPATDQTGRPDHNPLRDDLMQLLHDVEAAELAEDRRPPIHVGDITPVDNAQLPSAPSEG